MFSFSTFGKGELDEKSKSNSFLFPFHLFCFISSVFFFSFLFILTLGKRERATWIKNLKAIITMHKPSVLALGKYEEIKQVALHLLRTFQGKQKRQQKQKMWPKKIKR